MLARLLAVTVALAPIASAEQVQTSRLRYTVPDGWRRSVSEANVETLTPPDGGASVTFVASTEFAGTAEQWMDELWRGVVEDAQQAGAPATGVQGAFLTRMGVLLQPDGARPWVYLCGLVKDGRGEALLFFAQSDAQFFAHLATVNQLFHRAKVANRGAALPGSPNKPAAPVVAPAPTPPPAVAVAPTAGPLPVLEYTMAPDFSGPPGQGTYVSNNVDGMIQVYDFRAFTGKFEEEFRKTLLRDWIAHNNQEERVISPPTVQASSLAGATQVFTARFQQDAWGIVRERFRVAILASGAVAIVDVNLRDARAWQRYQDGITKFLGSLKIGARPPPVAAPPPSGVSGSVAGLYLASKTMFYLNPLGPAGSGTWRLGTEYYLLSNTGRVHRGQDLPNVPGGDISRFDYATAQQQSPGSAGTFTASGDQVVIRLGAAPHETITAHRLEEDVLEIYGVKFKRSLREDQSFSPAPAPAASVPANPPPPATAVPSAPDSFGGSLHFFGAFQTAAAPGKRPAIVLFGRDGRFACEGLREVVAGATADASFPPRAKGTYEIRDGALIVRVENANVPPIAIVLEGDPANPSAIRLNGVRFEREKRSAPAAKPQGTRP